MAINFPNNPNRDDLHVVDNTTWICISSLASGDTHDAWGRKAISSATNHDDLYNISGGTTDEYYHITSQESAAIIASNSPTIDNPFATIADLGTVEPAGTNIAMDMGTFSSPNNASIDAGGF